jgi:hypothetical protein
MYWMSASRPTTKRARRELVVEADLAAAAEADVAVVVIVEQPVVAAAVPQPELPAERWEPGCRRG